MKEVTRTLVVGRTINIDTEENDPVDIRCGGPRWLGFDFTVDAEEDIKDLEVFIKKCFQDNNRYYHNICISSSTVEVPKTQIWSRAKIKRCIKENDV